MRYTLFLFLMSLMVYSQDKTTMEGKVKDSLGVTMSYVNIIVKPQDQSKNLKFAISDSEGYYRLSIDKNELYSVSISYMGYETVEYELLTDKDFITKDFELKESEEMLGEIVIDIPISVRGDTITYNTGSFVNSKQRKLKDVLKELPGIEVDSKGGVTFQGRKVTDMLVEGKKFFGGDTKLAVENIPGDAIDKVQVIENYNDVSFLKSVSDGDAIAMNIILKEDKKNFAFGDLEASKGNNDYYKTHSNLFYFSPKTKVNFIGDINNIGEKSFTYMDYRNFLGGINIVFSDDFDWGRGDFSQFMQSKEITNGSQKFAGFNIIRSSNAKLDVSAYIILSKTNTDSFVEKISDYTSFVEESSNKSSVDDWLAMAKLSIEYKPSYREKLNIRTQVKILDNSYIDNKNSVIDMSNNFIEGKKDFEEKYINQNIEWHKKTSDIHTISSILNYSFRSGIDKSVWASEGFSFHSLVPMDYRQETAVLDQLKDKSTHNLDFVLKSFWKINPKNHIYITFGNKYIKEKLITGVSQILDSGVFSSFDNSGFDNNIDYDINDMFMGLKYKFKTGICIFSQGLSFHNYKWNIEQENILSKNKWVLLPYFKAKIKFNSSKSIDIKYDINTKFSDINSLTDNYYLTSYNSVFRGDKNISNSKYHNVNFKYKTYNLYRHFSLYFNANYKKAVKAVRTVVEFEGQNAFTTVKLFDNPSESIYTNVFMRKKINIIQLISSLGFSKYKYYQETDGVISSNESVNYNYRLEIKLDLDIENTPIIKLGMKQSISSYTSGGVVNEFKNTSPYINIDYDFLNSFVFSFDYKNNNYTNVQQGQDDNYEMANTKLSYSKEDSAWSFRIAVNNILDSRFKKTNSFSGYLISDTRTYILSRVVLFGLIYSL